MSGTIARSVSVVAGLSLLIVLGGCATWTAEAPVASHIAHAAPPAAPAPPQAPVATPLPEERVERAPPVAVSNEPEDFMCLDGSWVRVGYSEERDIARLSLNGATPVAMLRADESGLTAYRRQSLVLRRSGPRIAVTSEATSVVVRSGDTLGTIATRYYGDRQQASQIARANASSVEDPNLIYPGQVLLLPQVERQCRRSLRQQAAFSGASSGLTRRAFSPPSARQPELRPVRASSLDPD